MAKLDCFASSVTPLFGAPSEASMNWMDANARLVEIWLEWQRSMWQPLLDWQAAWALQWMDQAGMPGVGALAIRGSEQLG